jgi:hypothetical protein
MTVYENVVIGNFLFEFGYRLGVADAQLEEEVSQADTQLEPLSINLLQQTNEDRSLADVLIANAAFGRLIEFKRKRNISDKELLKRKHLEDGLNAHEAGDSLSRTSHQTHWYINIDDGTKRKPRFEVTAAPYLEFPDESSYISFDDFMDKSVKGALDENDENNEESDDIDQVVPASFAEYLKVVREINVNSKDKGHDAQASSSAFAIALTRSGNIQWFAVRDMQMMFKERAVLEKELKIERERDRESPDFTRMFEQVRGRGRRM